VRSLRGCWSALPLLLACLVCSPATAEEKSVAALKQRIVELEARLADLERLVGDIRSPDALEVAVVEPQREPVEPGDAVKASPPQSIEIGGALRFNLLYRDDLESSVGKRGESGLDIFRLNVDGAIDRLLVSAEYRFYPFMDVLHHGWVGYRFADDGQLEAGITQVPFGLLPYAAHNAWFGVPYYIGMADDYDIGVKYHRQDGPWNAALAFFKGEELGDASNLERYSFDLVRVDDQQNEESNQFNARLAYTFGLGSSCETEVGGSMQLGEVYNDRTDNRGDRWAGAAHIDSRCGRWNFQLQGAAYDYAVENPSGIDRDTVRMGAFAGSYDVASEGRVLVANVAYNLPPRWTFIDSITCYNDYSWLDKSLSGARDSHINTLGCAVGSGPLFSYFDYILARNMPYFGEGSLAAGGEDDWQSRLNINIGYYW